ncbi:MAG: hypothetical protein V3V81_08095 [Candidatus Bathyarchaeia archaeon]
MVKIRVYVCNWEKIGNRVTNPINKLADPNKIIPGLEWISFHYAEANPTDGTPTNPVCIAFVKADDFTDFDSIAGAVKLPAGNLTGSLSSSEKDIIVDKLFADLKVPKKVFTEAVSRKEILLALAKHIHPQFKDIGNIKEEEFE